MAAHARRLPLSLMALVATACHSSAPMSGAGAHDLGVADFGGGARDGGGGDLASSDGGARGYDDVVLADHPVAYWAMRHASGKEPDLSGHGHEGSYVAGAPGAASLPNGDLAADFDGATQYLTVPSSAALSVPTTHSLTWEAWIRPDVLQFPNEDTSSGAVAWMGKCEQYAPTCEWEARMYSLQTNEMPNRPNRISAYIFNPGAGLGSAADWQPAANIVAAGHWYHVVGEYTTLAQPADCTGTAQYPGSIDIWVNGVKWDHSSHGDTGCMSQYQIVPTANDSAVNIGSMATDSWFAGAIGKVAIYDYLLSDAQVTQHYRTMTGQAPTGSCAATCAF